LQSADLVEIFRHSPIFASLDEDKIRDIAALATPRILKKGQFVFLEGDIPQSFYLVQEGMVKVFKQSSYGRDFTIGVFHRSETFGEASAFDEKEPYSVSAQAITDTTLLTISRGEFLPFVARNPSVAMKLISVMAEGVRSANSRLRDLATDRVEQRLAKVLLILVAKHGTILPFTRHEIADMAGTTTETTIRIMNRLKGSGIVDSTRGKIIIHDRAKLKLLSVGPPHV